VFLQPQEAVVLRDELQAIDDPSAGRLAAQIDVAATMLLAAPLHAGVRAVRVADDERQVLLDVSRKREYVPGDSFAKLQYELSSASKEDRARRRVSNLVSLRLGGDHRHLAALVDRYHVPGAGAVLAKAAPERFAVAAHNDDRVRVGVSFNPEARRGVRLEERIQCVLPCPSGSMRQPWRVPFELDLLGNLFSCSSTAMRRPCLLSKWYCTSESRTARRTGTSWR
jgi:hypothetical protein